MGYRSRRRPELFETEKRALLARLGECRAAVIEARSHLVPGCDTCRRGDAVTEAIDDLVELLTGDREHFWAKPHTKSG